VAGTAATVGPSITEPARLRAVTEQAGLDIERVDRVVCPFDYADEEELLGSVFDSALGRAVGRRAGPVVLREAVLDRLAPYRTAAGSYRLENVFRVLVAHRKGWGGPVRRLAPSVRGVRGTGSFNRGRPSRHTGS
jgi:hypothetical protein